MLRQHSFHFLAVPANSGEIGTAVLHLFKKKCFPPHHRHHASPAVFRLGEVSSSWHLRYLFARKTRVVKRDILRARLVED